MSLPPALRELFHNVNPDSVDPQRDAGLVIRTVLASGTWEQVLWVVRRYGVARVREVVRADVEGLRTLPEPTRALWTLILLKGQVPAGGSFNADFPEDRLDRWRIRRRVPTSSREALPGSMELRTPDPSR